MDSQESKVVRMKERLDTIQNDFGFEENPSIISSKRELYKSIQSLLGQTWNKSVASLRSRSSDGLGLLHADHIDENDSQNNRDVQWLDYTSLHRSIRSAKSQGAVINTIVIATSASMQKIISETSRNLYAQPREDVEQILLWNQQQSHMSHNPVDAFRTKLQSGANTAVRTMWHMYGLASRLWKKTYGSLPTPQQWQQVSEGTLPIVTLMSKLHVDIFGLIRSIISIGGYVKGPHENTAPFDEQYCSLDLDAHSRPVILFHDSLYQRMIEELTTSQNRQSPHRPRIGCPAKFQISHLHDWNMDVARTFLFPTSEAYSALPIWHSKDEHSETL